MKILSKHYIFLRNQTERYTSYKIWWEESGLPEQFPAIIVVGGISYHKDFLTFSRKPQFLLFPALR